MGGFRRPESRSTSLTHNVIFLPGVNNSLSNMSDMSTLLTQLHQAFITNQDLDNDRSTRRKAGAVVAESKKQLRALLKGSGIGLADISPPKCILADALKHVQTLFLGGNATLLGKRPLDNAAAAHAGTPAGPARVYNNRLPRLRWETPQSLCQPCRESQ